MVDKPKHPRRKGEPDAAIDARIDEQIEESFPASDPPSYNAGGGRVGEPDRVAREPGRVAEKVAARPRRRRN